MGLSGILSIILIILVIVIMALALTYLSITLKEKSSNSSKKGNSTEKATGEASTKAFKDYSVKSIFDFMEFEKIEDNMIVQKNGKKFLMMIECQGINYDLMSEVEKNAVEIGFMKVLNTLREPIQIYIQTRTINLNNSIEQYKAKLETIGNNLNSAEVKYKRMIESNQYPEEEIQRQRIEIIKLENLYNYGKDIILNTEKMSLNKNILRKKYYIVTSYYANNSDNEYLSNEEIREMAFSDLYTRCQSIIRALGSAEVSGKVLDSNEIVDVLYNAYNRDEAELFGLNKAEEVNYDDLYVTSQDVLQRKMNSLNQKIEKEALDKAEEAILFADRKLEKEVEEKEENIEDLINSLAEELIDENAQYLDENIVEEAKKYIEAGGDNADEK